MRPICCQTVTDSRWLVKNDVGDASEGHFVFGTAVLPGVAKCYEFSVISFVCLRKRLSRIKLWKLRGRLKLWNIAVKSTKFDHKMKCKAYDCGRSDKKNRGIHFYRFPKDKDTRREWVKLCVENESDVPFFKITSSCRLCSVIINLIFKN